MTEAFYRTTLKNEYAARRKRNSRYSLRSFAKSLEVDVSIMSKVLADKEPLSVKSAEKILARMSFSERKKKLFVDSLIKEKTVRNLEKLNGDSKQQITTKIDQDKFKVIREWYHYAILELTFTEGFNSDPKWIAHALGISVLETKLAIDRLLGLGLLVRDANGMLKKQNLQLTTTDRKQTSEALMQYGASILQKSIDSIEKFSVQDRPMFNMTMAIDPEMLPIAAQMIEEFTNKVCQVLESGKQTRVYNMQTSLFPLQLKTESRL